MSLDFYIDLAGLPGPADICTIPPALEASHAAFVSPTRVANQRGAAMYFEHVRFKVDLNKPGNNITMTVGRVFVGGRTVGFQDTSMVPDLRTWSRSDAMRVSEIKQTTWKFRHSHSPAHAFAEATWTWEEARNQPLAFETEGVIYLTAFVADEPLFFPLNETDMRTLSDKPAAEAMKTAQVGTHIWGSLASAIDGGDGGLSLALNDFSVGTGMEIGRRASSIIWVLDTRETDPSFDYSDLWYKVPRMEFPGDGPVTIEQVSS